MGLAKGSRKRSDGFTLLELMMVVTLLGAFATLAGTSVGSFMADARQQNATYAVLKMARQAHDLARRSGKAHLLAFSQAQGNGHGAFNLFGGLSGSCLKSLWPAEADASYDLTAANPGPAEPRAADNNRHVIAASATRGEEPFEQLSLCIEPTGRSYTQVAGEGMALQTELVSLQVSRRYDGRLTGVTRNVVFEPGGTARVQR